MLWQCYTPLSFTQISSHNKIILKFPKFPNISQNSQYSHKIPNIPGGNLPLSKFPGILHPYFELTLYIWRQHEKYIQLSRNKLDTGPVVLEINYCGFKKNASKFKLSYT